MLNVENIEMERDMGNEVHAAPGSSNRNVVMTEWVSPSGFICREKLMAEDEGIIEGDYLN